MIGASVDNFLGGRIRVRSRTSFFKLQQSLRALFNVTNDGEVKVLRLGLRKQATSDQRSEQQSKRTGCDWCTSVPTSFRAFKLHLRLGEKRQEHITNTPQLSTDTAALHR